MGKRIRHRGDCCGCVYFPKSLIVRVKKGATTYQRTANSSTELVADKRRNWSSTQVELVFGIECGIPMDFKQSAVEVVTSRLGRHLDDTATVSAIFRVKGLGEDADLAPFIYSEKKS